MSDTGKPNTQDQIFEILAEVKQDKESRYQHRLHAVLLVLSGMSARQVSDLLGESKVTVASWVRKFRGGGVDALKEKKRPGRPKRLSEAQKLQIAHAIKSKSQGRSWDGNLLAYYIKVNFGIELSVRQCQRLLQKLPSL